MTTIQSTSNSVDVKKEVSALRKVAQKMGTTRKSARQFLLTTGIYTAQGQVKPQYR